MHEKTSFKEELRRIKKSNFKERIWFIKYWIEYMKTHPDEEWSEGQRKLIDAQFENLS
jgi:hypothetical protein